MAATASHASRPALFWEALAGSIARALFTGSDAIFSRLLKYISQTTAKDQQNSHAMSASCWA
jgi:hypothetical protein